MRVTLLIVLLLGAAACGVDPADGTGREAVFTSALAEEGPWMISSQALTRSADFHYEYESAGWWMGSQSCSGRIRPGADIVRDYLRAHFPQVKKIGGYNCRRIRGSERTSIHATGRALDIFVPLDGGRADNGLGDPIGDFLVRNAEPIGVQYIIWDNYTWNADRPAGNRGKRYGGSHAHHDHLHVEIIDENASRQANWFEDDVEGLNATRKRMPGPMDECRPLPFEGGVMEENNLCCWFEELAWKSRNRGHGDSSLWLEGSAITARSNERPVVEWDIATSARGEYLVEVFIPSGSSNSGSRYVVASATDTNVITIDQGAESGWVSLGQFDFEAGRKQHVAMYVERTKGEIASLDALRLTRTGDAWIPPEHATAPSETEDEFVSELSASTSTSESASLSCSCSLRPIDSSRQVSWLALLVLGSWLAGRVACRRGRVSDPQRDRQNDRIA